MSHTVRIALNWVSIGAGILYFLAGLLRLKRLPRIVAYGNMLAGAGWVIAGVGWLALLTSVPAQIGVNVGLLIALIGVVLRLFARDAPVGCSSRFGAETTFGRSIPHMGGLQMPLQPYE